MSCTTPNVLQLGDAAEIQVKALNPDGTADDVTGATGLVLRISHAASGSIDLPTPAVVDGPAGIFGATAAAGVLAYAGDWQVQGTYTPSGESSRRTAVGSFRVEGNLPDPAP